MRRRHRVVICLERVSSVRRVVEAIAVPAVVIGWPEYIIEVAREIVGIDVDVADVKRDCWTKPLAVFVVPFVIVK